MTDPMRGRVRVIHADSRDALRAPTTVAEAERLGYVAVGLIVDPDYCRRFVPDIFVREDGMCWARFPMRESEAG